MSNTWEFRKWETKGAGCEVSEENSWKEEDTEAQSDLINPVRSAALCAPSYLIKAGKMCMPQPKSSLCVLTAVMSAVKTLKMFHSLIKQKQNKKKEKREEKSLL